MKNVQAVTVSEAFQQLIIEGLKDKISFNQHILGSIHKKVYVPVQFSWLSDHHSCQNTF